MSLAASADIEKKPWPRLDKLGVLVAIIGLAGLALPFALFRANRIVPGEGMGIVGSLDGVWSILLIAAIVAALATALVRFRPIFKLAAGFLALAVLAFAIGAAANHLTPADNNYARVAPGAGFWLLLLAFSLMVTDALTRLRLRPVWRVALLALVLGAVALILWSGLWSNLSLLKEYASRAPAFWQEARTHLVLAFGSVAIATLAGIPLGILCYRVKPLRAAVLNTLNIVQTIPSIALFGLLIAPLAWVAANIPGASSIGISGIGIAPALIALFAYSLLPIVSNTVVGLLGVNGQVVDAARGMGMTDRQRLLNIELPLALPVILTGIRIVLVQNIGLATIAALIGGGGFGVFVFQGIGQTAMDLVLLGAVPTVGLAFAAAVILDAIVEQISIKGRGA
ncbi:ABC transporter permease [Devosia sp. BK]|uniref:ABC transporter permease n=1 Tax=Devosia sp. BK TaxID=2871706 RepID=UPI002939A3D3|nr:ABC transporter permease [Devosia sp. BK]MDV3249873.1 ABC transporter permease [Devosia sp. BK]